ncbi:rnhA operon protein [Halobacteriales archaeon SW_6_65_15]|jgi:NTP pyrophosphatase (non-canonical NTP hydrolase)|nr:MAG: rnhA operon protein [Halobacteriales archaeon SW_6_65_15]
MPEDESDAPDASETATSDASETETSNELPEETVEQAERLTRLAREAVDDAEAAAYREERADLLADHGFTARVREDDAGETLVLHPDEWTEDGVIRTDRIEDTSRAVEVSLSGPGDPDEWDAVDERNREVVARVRETHGEVHGDNAEAFADFMSNHYARPVESATDDEIAEFLSEYFPRNAWPSEKQRATVEDSLELVFEVADE